MQVQPDATKIRRWREERYWSQEHLADLAGIGLRTIQRIETGEPASRDSMMALAAAFDVNVIDLTFNAKRQAEEEEKQKTAKGIAALRLGFGINLACYLFGMIVFAGISLSDGQPGYAMLSPAIWWTVGVAGFGLAVVLVELVARHKTQIGAGR
ncbi:MAG: helix-turn-helix transcriptional regulator [Pseudomonadota bacterium]